MKIRESNLILEGSEKKEKRIKLKDICTENNTFQEMNINNILHDDCLINVFEYLEYQDRLKIEHVCKRWYRVGKLSWNNIKSLRLSSTMKPKYILYPDNAENTMFIIKIIRRASKFLNNICIKNCFDINYYLIFQEIITNCQNIYTLSLHALYHIKRRICREADLSILFKNNKNLTSVYISGIYTIGECLKYLNASCLNYLKFEFSTCVYENNISNLSKFKNLKELEVFMINKSCKITNALIQNECENIHGLTVYMYDEKVPILSLICKQKFLSKICIRESNVDRNFLENLPQTLIHLEINTDENGLSCLHRFKNLINFSLEIDDLTDESIKYLTKCLTLKEIKIYAKKFSKLTFVGESYFKLFQKIEKLDLVNFCKNSYWNLDNILFIISKFKSLKRLSVSGFDSTETSVNNICLLLDIQELDISYTKICHKDLIKIADKLINLKKLNFKNCINVNYNIFEAINTLKLNRNEKNIINIYFGGYKLYNYVNEKLLSLVSLNDIKYQNRCSY